MKDIGKRLRNRATLIALGSQFLIIFGVIYYYVTGEMMPLGLTANFALFGGAILVILTVLGILNDPTTVNKGLKDDPPMYR